MKKSFATIGLSRVPLLLLASCLLISSCAPVPADSRLQQKIDELLLTQQQQAEELAALKRQLAGMGAPAPATGTVEPASQPVPTQTEPARSLPTVAAEEIAEMSESAGLYLASFAAIATGRMADAADGFRSFIERYPSHEYVGNASYWLAEAMFALQKPKRAETLLLDIIDNPQQQAKAPAAMARLVRYYRESGARNNADAMSQLLKSRFPESPELNRLQQETPR